MSKSPFLSVIIPTYNVEKYIESTLNSIANQTFFDYEIIIVDDESSDHTVQVCENYSKDNPQINIEIYKLNHGGVSNARNYGISKARGEYIHFMDSDDEIMPIMYSTYFDIIKKTHFDLVIGSVIIQKSSFSIQQTIENDIDCPFRAKMVRWLREISIQEKDWMLNVVWNKWFKRELIINHHLTFKDICPGEDYEFVMNFLSFCNSVYVSSKLVYKYYQRETLSLLKRKYSHKSQIERRSVNWETTHHTLAEIGVFNPTFLLAEGYSLYSAIYCDMQSGFVNYRLLKDYFSLKQYDCIELYFKSRGTFLNTIVGKVFASKNVCLIEFYFWSKKIIENFIKYRYDKYNSANL